MITLLLTLFISLFSICPSNYQVEDHNENTITLSESPSVKNFGYNDEYGVQLYMSHGDFLSNEFILDFISAIAGGTGSPNNYLSYSNADTGNITLNTGGAFYGTSYNVVGSKIVDCTTIVLDKYDAVLHNSQYGDPGIITFYHLTFYNNSTTLLNYDYAILYPLTDEWEHELHTVVIPSGYTQYLNTIYFLYFENSLDGTYTPMITYYYDVYLGQKISIINDNYNRGYNDGRSYGYQTGYNQALEDYDAYDTTASTIFNGALEIGLLPVNFFLSIFNFEVFGINIKSIVSALLTLAVVIIIVRFLFGGKDDK